MEAIAKYNKINLSARKARKVVDLIRSMNVPQAVKVLQHLPQKAAPYVKNVLLSAVANLNQKQQGKVLLSSAIKIKEIYVNMGPVLKRIKPAPQGRAHPIRKPSAHIFVKVELDDAKQNKSATIKKGGEKPLSDSKKAAPKSKNLSTAPSKTQDTPAKADKTAKANAAPAKDTAPKAAESTAPKEAAKKPAAEAPKAKAAPVKAASPKAAESTASKEAAKKPAAEAPKAKAAPVKATSPKKAESPAPKEAAKKPAAEASKAKAAPVKAASPKATESKATEAPEAEAEATKQPNTPKEAKENTEPLQKK